MKPASYLAETPVRPQNPAPSEGRARGIPEAPTNDRLAASLEPQPKGITEAAYALRRDVSPPKVALWKSRGLLVLDADGLVLEAASNARLDAIRDPDQLKLLF